MRRFLVLLALLAPMPVSATEPFELKDGDHVVFVGSTLIEREQRYGYWETALTARYPDRNITFRNLGWSGDTVWGEARAGFDAPAVGYKRLVEQTLALKPTVIFLGYGTNESFAGKEGLEHFQQQLEKLLDDLAPSKARVVLVTPLYHEKLDRPLPDPARQNDILELYSDTIGKIAKKRKSHLLQLFEFVGIWSHIHPWRPFTDNGIHLTPHGYLLTAGILEQSLISSRGWGLELDAGGKLLKQNDARVKKVQLNPLRFEVLDAKLPVPLPPSDFPRKESGGHSYYRALRVKGLAEGRYALKIDGKPILSSTALDWSQGITLERGLHRSPEWEQVEKLRQTIVEKNQLFFHRYRPQNETYLFGFRKHEQGQNAKEIAQFDPLIEKLEKEIARLRVPVEHTYELVPASEEKK